jgi:hypothetical protein
MFCLCSVGQDASNVSCKYLVNKKPAEAGSLPSHPWVVTLYLLEIDI